MEFNILENMDVIEKNTISGQVKAVMLLGVSILFAVIYFAFRPNFDTTYDKVSEISQV